VQRGQASIIASVITESELLVRPERDGNRDAIERITDLLSEDGIFVVDVDHRIARRAAALRGAALREAAKRTEKGSGFKLPDAIIIATAIETGCDVIVSRDGGWRRVTDIPIVHLDDAVTAR
jgi:predicted nucleic acid-binding protein